MGHSRDLRLCLSPAFFLSEERRRRFSLVDTAGTARCCGGVASCSYLLVVCAWLALPLACDFALRQNRWLADHDVHSLLRAAQSAVPRIDVRVVDGRATWFPARDVVDDSTDATSCAANLADGARRDCSGPAAPRARDGNALPFAPRVEFPRPFYQLFEDSAFKGDAISTWFFDTAMATTLRCLDPTWPDDSYSFHVATPVEFIEGDIVEARPPGSLVWAPATIVSVEPSTKLNKFNYTLKWANSSNDDGPGDQHGATDVETSATAAERAAEGLSHQVVALTAPGSIFTGVYNCGGGRSLFSVEFQDHPSRPIYAEFSFQHDRGNGTVCTGSFYMLGELSGSSRLELQPVGEFGSQTDGWSSNPCNYSSVALIGEVDPGEDSVPAFRGDVVDAFETCSKFSGFVQPAPVSFSARVIGAWWGDGNTNRAVRLEISARGARMELIDSNSASDSSATNTSATKKAALQRVLSAAINSVSSTIHERLEAAVSSQRVEGEGAGEADTDADADADAERIGKAWLASLATSLSDREDYATNTVDEDDVLGLLISLILAEHSVLDFGLSEIRSWEEGESTIALKLKFDVGEADMITQLLSFEVATPSVVADTLRRQVIYALNVQGKDELSRDLLSIARPTPVCPSTACDIQLKSSRIRRAPAVAFVLDQDMVDQTKWSQFRAAVVITETSMYLFEGYSHHFGAYWRFEGDADGDEGPELPLTEASLQRHTPLWVYTRLLCDTGPRGQNRVKGSPTLNLDCTAKVADQKLRKMADMAASSGVAIAMTFRAHVFLIDLVVWLGYTLHIFLYHVLNWMLIYVPSAYVVVNLLRHVDTATASVNQVATISVYTYTPLLVATDVITAVLHIGRLSNDSRDASISLSPEITSLLEEALEAFWTQLALFLLWTAYIFMLLRAKDEEAKCAAAAVARGRRMEQAPCSKYQDSFAGDPMCRICLGDEDDGRLISPCLCKGTMRFVHVECLTQWRTTSQNKESFFACDSCQYRYSFRRPAWASLLRSALVVHCVAAIIFVLLIALCGHTANVADALFFDDALSRQFSVNFDDEQMAEAHKLSMELYGELYGGIFQSDSSILGLSLVQLTTGAALVGLGGFVSSGFVTALIWGRRDNGIFFFAIVYGLVVSFIQVYETVKDASSAWLKLAETNVLDVGVGAHTHGYLATHSMALYYRAGRHEPRLSDWYQRLG